MSFNRTRSTSLCYNPTHTCNIQLYTKYTKMNLSTVKWAQWDKNKSRKLLVCSYVCALHCAQLLYTVLHRTDLIIFPLTLQKITDWASCPYILYTLLCWNTRSSVKGSVSITERDNRSRQSESSKSPHTVLMQRDHTVCYVTWNLVNCCATVLNVALKKACNRQMILKATQGHQKCCNSIGHISIPISGL